LKRAIFFRSLLIALAALIISGGISVFILQNQYTQSKRGEMKQLLNVMAQVNNLPDGEALTNELSAMTADSLRVTVISSSGEVLGDSAHDPTTMENHENRPEFKEAILTGYGEDIRRSNTLGTSMIYVSKKLPDGNVIRLAANLKSINDHIWALFPALLIGILLALLITPLLAWRLSSGIIKPFGEVANALKRINSGNFDNVINTPEFIEFIPITDEINTLSQKITNTLRELTTERERIGYLLSNMNEGFVILDSKLQILIINRSAASFFGVDQKIEGKNLLHLTYQPKICEAAEIATHNRKPEVFDYTSSIDNRILQISISPVRGESQDDEVGVVMLITDVTAIRKAEQIRSEFVANASHELKTPLTSIKGFTELIETGIVKNEESVKNYLSLIRTETDRMIILINDILRLSELETIIVDSNVSRVSLKKIAQHVAKSLTVQAEENDIKIKIMGDAGILRANPDRMTQLMLNLIENAIKYNKNGGKVDIDITKTVGTVTLCITDTGVGIPKEAQERVFERFYRVDKSRSRKMGGTGLGLSIVKHIVGLYKGNIKLVSEVGIGTKIEVILPE